MFDSFLFLFWVSTPLVGFILSRAALMVVILLSLLAFDPGWGPRSQCWLCVEVGLSSSPHKMKEDLQKSVQE